MIPRPLILVVDDDADIREALTDTLGDEGYEVATAENGAEALSWLASGRLPALILLDLTMPVMDGPTFRRELLARPGYAALKVVLITADRRAPERVKDLPHDGVLPKPVSIDALLAMIAKHAR